MEKVFTFVYKFTYFKLFHEHVISLNFFKTTIPDQMNQTASEHEHAVTRPPAAGGFEQEHAPSTQPYRQG
jgi:hypothetical protein